MSIRRDRVIQLPFIVMIPVFLNGPELINRDLSPNPHDKRPRSYGPAAPELFVNGNEGNVILQRKQIFAMRVSNA
jgi:hypothetical protein